MNSMGDEREMYFSAFDRRELEEKIFPVSALTVPGGVIWFKCFGRA